jgi:predicted outer membrane protein
MSTRLLTRWTTAIVAAGTFTLMATNLMAQDRTQQYEADKPVIGRVQQAGANSADSQLASCLIVDNQGEIALGKLAQQKSKDNDVKQFAEKMVQDHTQFMKQLEQFAGAQDGNANMNATGPLQGAGSTDRAVPGAMMQPMGGQALNFVALKQEIGKKCLEMTEREMQQKEGSQFDKCYIGQQIGAHMQVLATLEVVRNQASPELASVLDKGIETTKTHLEHAQKLAKSLESTASR